MTKITENNIERYAIEELENVFRQWEMFFIEFKKEFHD